MPRKLVPAAPVATFPAGPVRRRILILGSVQDIPEVLRDCDGASVVIAPYRVLDTGLLVRSRPDCILVPLIGTGHDMADVAERLSALAYQGILRCYGRPLPRRDEVVQSLSEAFPGIVFEFVEVPR